MGLSLQPAHLKRYKDIAWLLARYGRPNILQSAGLEEINVEDAESAASAATAEQLAKDLEKLGPTFVKLGQILSTRPDLLPLEYTEALSRLQDNVEPFPFAQVEQIVTRELSLRMSKAFKEFDPNPLAAASLGQVHRAKMRDGREVAVKVQRPGVRAVIASDLEVLGQIAAFIDAHTDFGKTHHLSDFLSEFAKSLARELDYRKEAQNLVTLGNNLQEFERLVVPKPIDSYTTGVVLTMDYIAGTKLTVLSDIAKLEIDTKELVSELFRAYLKQILVDGFFHADPHPGNVFLTRDHRLALIDLGMVAFISPRLQASLTQLVFAIAEGRSDDVVTYSLNISTRTPNFDEAGFVRDVTDLVGEQRDTNLSKLEVGKVALAILRLSSLHGLTVAPELGMLGKALLNLDQVGRLIDPTFDPTEAVRQSATQIMRHQMAESVAPGRIFQNLIEIKEFSERLPGRVNRILDAIANNQIQVQVRAFDETKLIGGFHKIANRITLGLILSALVIAAAMLMQVPSTFRLFGYPGLAIIFFGMAALGAVLLAVRILRDDSNRT